MTYNYTDISLTEMVGEISLILYSGSCINQCPWCFNGELLKRKPLSFKQMKDAIDEHLGFITAVVFSGGEPLLNPFLIKIINYAKSKGLKTKLNTCGLVDDNTRKNMFIPYVDYINVSLKGLPHHYNEVLKSFKVHPIILHCDILEYSFVYSTSIWPPKYLNMFHDFLKNKIKFDWYSMFYDKDWTRPDIFTVSQIKTGSCLNEMYNDCSIPLEQECIDVAKIFSDIPIKQLVIETEKSGRKYINIKRNKC